MRYFVLMDKLFLRRSLIGFLAVFALLTELLVVVECLKRSSFIIGYSKTSWLVSSLAVIN